jgi:hypothetical protein
MSDASHARAALGARSAGRAECDLEIYRLGGLATAVSLCGVYLVVGTPRLLLVAR